MEVPTQQAPPPEKPLASKLSSRRPPGMKPVEVVAENPSWAKFRDPQTGLFYYLSRSTGETTYDRPMPLGHTSSGDGLDMDAYSNSHPNNNIDSSVNHFKNVVNSTKGAGSGDVPASQRMGPPPPSSTKPLSPSSAPAPKPFHYYKLIREVDMTLFVACRDARPSAYLDNLIGGDVDIEDDAFAEVNRQWCAKSDGSGWDVLPDDERGSSTSFFWPAFLKPTTHKRNAYAAVPGDTILHIAIKLDKRDILEWLSTVKKLDLNVVNSEGLTASAVADELNRSNMYTFFFVFR
mmetsp:Transcript_12763/g.26004  ORF Transcript_12763/g.26004 Transcript_12763/m.26004 type:complete len:291 (+) Transcript_12763:80-952(+)